MIKGYIKANGTYIEIDSSCPVSPTHIECAVQPTEAHILADNWQDDPMNPAVCWRPMTAEELLMRDGIEEDGIAVPTSGGWSDLDVGQMRAVRIHQLRDEAIRLIQTRFLAIKDVDDLVFFRDFWMSIAPAARQPTANFQYVLDVYQVWTTERSSIRGLTAFELASYDAVTTPAWP